MKYKLIKEFPGSGAIGSIYELSDEHPYNPMVEFFEVIKEEEKRPEFTTTDGVDVYVGDEFILVPSDFNIIFTKTCKKDQTFSGYHRTFSTREAALEFIEEYTPRYSLNDIKNSQFTLGSLLNSPEDEANVLLIDMDLLQR